MVEWIEVWASSYFLPLYTSSSTASNEERNIAHVPSNPVQIQGTRGEENPFLFLLSRLLSHTYEVAILTKIHLAKPSFKFASMSTSLALQSFWAGLLLLLKLLFLLPFSVKMKKEEKEKKKPCDVTMDFLLFFFPGTSSSFSSSLASSRFLCPSFE